jgi:hypothetical protein
MANSIALAKKYLPLLDEVYKVAAKSSILDAPANLVREAMNANEILIPKIALQGLGNYNNASGFVAGDVTFEWQTHAFTQNRGRTFSIDAVQDMETLDVAFGATTSQFIRTKVTPEVDAYRFAKLAAKAGTSPTGATLTADTAIQAIDLAKKTFMDEEVDEENTVLFVSPEVYMFMKQTNVLTRQMNVAGTGTVNREIEYLDRTPVVVVPQGRFYTGITLYDGTTSGQEAGGYIKTVSTGKDINFLLVDKAVALGVTKTALPRIFTPEENQTAHAWKFDYRLYHDLFVPDNKVKGIYLHKKA